MGSLFIQNMSGKQELILKKMHACIHMCVCVCIIVGCKYFDDIHFPDGNKHVRTAISQIKTIITCRSFSAKAPLVV